MSEFPRNAPQKVGKSSLSSAGIWHCHGVVSRFHKQTFKMTKSWKISLKSQRISIILCGFFKAVRLFQFCWFHLFQQNNELQAHFQWGFFFLLGKLKLSTSDIVRWRFYFIFTSVVSIVVAFIKLEVKKRDLHRLKPWLWYGLYLENHFYFSRTSSVKKNFAVQREERGRKNGEHKQCKHNEQPESECGCKNFAANRLLRVFRNKTNGCACTSVHSVSSVCSHCVCVCV